mmetsp:Transcript_8241/g.16956  ORF Transcript_8241/g.16956 Transcript_8241/m.16956 type:complete len:120 (+) Transcript_8241:147-506(+)
MSKIRFELSLLTVVCSPKYSVSDFSKSSIYHHIYTSFKRPPRSSAKERTPWKPIYTLSSRPRGTILVLDASPFDSLVGRDSFASENYWIYPHPLPTMTTRMMQQQTRGVLHDKTQMPWR